MVLKLLLLVVGLAVVVGAVVVVVRRTESTVNGSGAVAGWFRRLVEATGFSEVAEGESPAAGSETFDVSRYQRAVVNETLKKAWKTLGSRRAILGNDVRVAVSSEAEQTLRTRGMAASIDEIVQELRRIAQNGKYEIPADLSLRLEADPTLTGLQAVATPRTVERPKVVLRAVRGIVGEKEVPSDQSELLIGRAVAEDEFLVNSERVSKTHAKVRVVALNETEQRLVIQDLKSTNGTTLNGEQLTIGEDHPLAENDEIGLGPDVRLRVVVIRPEAVGGRPDEVAFDDDETPRSHPMDTENDLSDTSDSTTPEGQK
ncbi:MAG: FHA domain-containing protein [Aeromicrobium sp.]|uniref:FHA domain-containing protein n=1 Tax=Aeromicrobium sp. TaxID=1871063 RepID=UPI0039E5320A